MKKAFLISTVIFSLLLATCVSSSVPAPVYAAEETLEQKGLIILNDAVGLDLTKYAVTTNDYIQNYNSSYLGVIPQQDVEYEFTSEGSRVKALCTFANSRLQMMHVLESTGSPYVTKAAVGSVELAENFLRDYQAYTEDSLYGELKSTLDNVDAGENFTKTSGNTQLEVKTNNGYTSFKWTYTINDAIAPSKFVSLGFKNGFLTAFVDNWQLYEVGSTNVVLSEDDAKAIAVNTARTHSWSLKLDADTLDEKNLNESNVCWTALIFDGSLDADMMRSEDPLVLFPVWRIGVALDKWYGHLYGIAVDIWADTGEVKSIQEAWSTLPPPEGVLTADMSAVETSTSPVSSAGAFNLFGVAPNLFLCIVLPTLATAWVGTIVFWMTKTKSHKYNLPKPLSLRTGGTLVCILLLSIVLLAPIATVSATDRAAVVWGSESAGAIDPQTQQSWRKSQTEIGLQQEMAEDIEGYFDQGGYVGYDKQGETDSLKSNILYNIRDLSTSKDCLAVVDFDHGIGKSNYTGDYGTFHFMFEDNNGTVVGTHGQENINWTYAPENGVYDMDIHSNLTDHSKVAFAFINTCLSARLTNPENNETWQGLFDGKARGMPFAWTNRTVVNRDTSGFTISLNMSKDGYSEPDDGSQCYIGFPFGSAALEQEIPYDYGPQYYLWVDYFFDHATRYDMSVNKALDHASWQTWGVQFGDSDLRNGFTAIWPQKNSTGHWVNGEGEGSTMAVYGNGNIKLRNYTPGWSDDFNDNSMDTSKWDTLQKGGAYASETTNQLTVNVPSGQGQGIAGYVTDNYYDVKDWRATVKVSEFNDLGEMILQICNTKITDDDPYDENNWYRILKARYDSKVYVQNCINGQVSTKVATTWAGATGNLTIDIAGGSIAFYENGILRYADPYALSSYNCYIYAFTSTDKTQLIGVETDKFDDFAFSQTPSFSDYFADGDNDTWTIDWGDWTVQNGKLRTTETHSMIHTDANFSENRHVKADLETLTAGNEDWQVAWLRAKWENWDNQLYAGIKKNGYVEVGIRYNGNQDGWSTYAGLSQYDPHVIAVSIIGTQVIAWVDGTEYINETHAWADNISGSVGLDAHMSTAEFDNVIVLD